jgi:hypothetical protein
VARIEEDRLLLDVRTIPDHALVPLAAAVTAALAALAAMR